MNPLRPVVASVLLIGLWLGVLAPGPAAAAQPIGADGPVLEARTSMPNDGQVEPGSASVVAVTMDFADGWHAWPNKPVLPPELEGFEPIPTTVHAPDEGAAAPAGITVHFDRVQWPEPELIETKALTMTPLALASYAGESVAFVPVTVAADVKPGTYTLQLRLSYQACDESMCLPPQTVELAVNVQVAEGVEWGEVASESPWKEYSGPIGPVAAGELASDAAGEDAFPASLIEGDAEVAAAAVSQRPVVSPGDRLAVAVVIDFADGWHAWPNKPVMPPELADFPAIPTQIHGPNGPDGDPAADLAPAGVRVHLGKTQWPEPHKVSVGFLGDPVLLPVYEGRAIAYVPVAISSDAPLGEATLRLAVSYQACNDTTCLQQQTINVPVTLTIAAPGTAGGESPAGTASLFEGFDPAVLATLGDGGSGSGSGSGGSGSSGGTEAPAATAAVPERAEAPAGSFFGIGLSGSWALLFALAVLGGFILNLTPCVLPVIPIKILTISKHAGTPGKSLYLGLAMAVGVVAFWAALAIPALLFASFADPSRIFGIWWVTLGLGLIIAAMSIGLMGMFQITLPSGVYSVTPKADSLGGSFLFGVMTGVLGLPCFGFVAGALLAAAATLPSFVTVLIFVGIGIGMAAPYLVLSAKPSWVDRIPRTGPASELVKQIMGLLLLAAAAYFVGSGLIALVSEKPWLARQLHIWVVGLLCAAAGVWLLVRTFQITSKSGRRAVFSVVAVALTGAGLLVAVRSTDAAREKWIARQEALAAQDVGQLIPGIWLDYQPALLEKARESGNVVVLNFTAEWCLNCKFLKAAVLDSETVAATLKQDGVILMTVDLSADSAPGWQLLRQLGRTGIPLLAIYTPGKQEPWLANGYTRDQVIEAVTQARSGRSGIADRSLQTAQHELPTQVAKGRTERPSGR